MRSRAIGRAAVLGFGIVLFGSVDPASAAIIDFTNPAAWAGVNGNWIYTSSTTFNGVTVTVTSQGPGGLLTFNSGADVNPTCAAVTGLACGGDGLGVGDDEITAGSGLSDPALERLYVYFSAPVSISRLGFLDLFARNTLVGDVAAETARWAVLHWSTGGIDAGSLTGTDATATLGYASTATNFTDVRALLFYAAPPSSGNSDFALASLDMTPVPEPSTLLLLGSGLAAAASRRRRRRT